MPAATNILVIKLGALGDIILAMDAFQAIRRHHAGARITLLTRQSFVAFTRQMPWFDEVWTDPAPKFWQVPKWLAFRRHLRAGKFQRVYDLQCNDRAGFYFKLLGPGRPEWCGVARGCSHPRPDFGGENLPVTERLWRLVEAAGVPRGGAADLGWLDGDLAGFALPERLVVLVPGCAPQHPYKRWPAGHFAALALKLAERGVATVAIGTAVDQAAIAEIQALAPAVINLAGKTDLGQIAALARRAEAVVGNDTGPVHLTGIVGAPTLVLMSRVTDPVRMLPRGPAVSWLKRDELADLTVDEVLAAILRSMKPSALILDRDGTLIEHVPYLSDPAEVRLLPGVREALQTALDAGVRLFLHSNQSGVGRGLFEASAVAACNDRLIELLDLGPAPFERICIAPEAPDQPSAYRKPSPLFAREIMRDFGLAPAAVCYLGDRGSDLATAKAAGTCGVGVATGLDDLRAELAELGLTGNFPVFDSLGDAIRYLFPNP